MFHSLRHLFVPHQHNRFSPLFFRTQTIFFVVVGALCVEVASWALPYFFEKKGFYTAEVLQSVITSLSNAEREKAGFPALTEDPLLDQVATLKAQDMAEKGYFAHTSPKGVTPWYWFNVVGYRYEYAGENLALHFNTSADVVASWVSSPAHYANLVKEQYTHMGTGVAQGMYEGVESVFVVQVYARPLKMGVSVQKKEESLAKKQKEIISLTTTSFGVPTTTIIQRSGEVLGATQESVRGVAFSHMLWNWFITSPHKIAYTLLTLLLVLACVVFLLASFVHVRTQHVSVLKNGAFLLIALSILVATEVFVSSSQSPQTTFITSRDTVSLVW